jgi:photosystem II stability/assembly factor-like uncharacterized protein
MRRITLLFLIAFSLFSVNSHAQQYTIQILDSTHAISIRGLSVVDNNTIWASGSKGSVAKSTNGGTSFEWYRVKGYEQRDFRDIAAFDSNNAVIIAVAEPAIILRTNDGGHTWKKVFEDTTKGMFLDAMDFNNKGYGVVIGDPINNNLFKAFTIDYGNSWKSLHMADPGMQLKDGEAFFASSGTNVVATNNKNNPFIYATGGKISRLIYKDAFYNLNLLSNKESTGANAIALAPDGKNAIVVGGDFADDKNAEQNCILVQLNKQPVFTVPQTGPHGYRSCVAYINNKQLISCGTSGVDISADGGKNWQLISGHSFHVCQKAKNGNAVFLAGANGVIARLQY